MSNIPVCTAIRTLGIAACLLAVSSACGEPSPLRYAEYDSPTELVNTLMGTDSTFDLSNGNTYPAVAVPWGMNFWTPMTAKMGDGWAYKYDDNKIRGIKQTHQPSPWLNDYAAFSLMAVTGELRYEENERASWFSHKAEEAKPHYYRVYLAEYDVTAEVSPTERAAHFRFTFPDASSDDNLAYIVLDAFDKGSMVRIIPEERKIVGYARNNHGGVPDNFHNYFVATFDKDFEVAHSWGDGWRLQRGVHRSEGEHVGAIVGFRTRRGEQVNVRVASSFISHRQAELNLERELADRSFDDTRRRALAAWDRELGRIRIYDADLAAIRTFYSCLYRVLLFPRRFYELDAEGEIVHYSPYDGEVHAGYMYTDNGFWDTFRAVFPFFALMYPDFNARVMQGLANTYRQSGWLPEWASPGHRNVMIGSNSAVNIADAYVKGIRGFDVDTLYAAIEKNASVNEGRPMTSVGREGVDYYNELGYVPYDVGIAENAARTLEYAFADFTISELARLLGKERDVEKYRRRARNYRNVFDAETRWMRGRLENGEFQAPFNPLKWGDAFTEGNSLHYSWSVFHDVSGLIELMGGRDAFTARLDEVLDTPPHFDDSYYGFTIHEIREMQIVDMGNYAHGNQPIQHMLYLYNHAGKPWKAQRHLRDVMTRLYSATPDGYAGDEDNGQTSAWYVFSALGFYPVTPGTTQYVFGSPLFDKVVMKMHSAGDSGSEAEFTITAADNSAANVYVQSTHLNGHTYEKTWIDHRDLQTGGELLFQMGAEPNKNWATGDGAAPYSMSAP